MIKVEWKNSNSWALVVETVPVYQIIAQIRIVNGKAVFQPKERFNIATDDMCVIASEMKRRESL